MRLIDADKLEAQCKEIIAHEWNKKAAPVSWAHAYESFLDMLETATTIDTKQWHPASEPPKEYRDEYGELIPFLVCEDGTEYPFRAMYDGRCWGSGICVVPVKWWMPLPKPPKEDEDEKV